MSRRVQRTIAASLGLLLVLMALILPWLGLEQYRGDTRFVLLSVLLFMVAGGFYFWATRPDLLKIYWIVLAVVLALSALLVHWLTEGYVQVARQGGI